MRNQNNLSITHTLNIRPHDKAAKLRDSATISDNKYANQTCSNCNHHKIHNQFTKCKIKKCKNVHPLATCHLHNTEIIQTST